MGSSAPPCCLAASALTSRLPSPPSPPSAPTPPLRRRMLVKDPGQRISMPGIMSHPWFVKDMPPALQGLNERVDPEAASRQVRAALAGSQARTPPSWAACSCVLVCAPHGPLAARSAAPAALAVGSPPTSPRAAKPCTLSPALLFSCSRSRRRRWWAWCARRRPACASSTPTTLTRWRTTSWLKKRRMTSWRVRLPACLPACFVCMTA